MELQKRFTYYDLITTLQGLPVPGQKSAAAIYECTIGRSEVFDEELAILIHDSRMTAGDFGLRIILIEVDIGEYSAISIPPPDVGLGGGHRKLFADPPPPLYDQLAAHLDLTLLVLLIIGSERIGTASRSQNESLARALGLGRRSALRRARAGRWLTLIADGPGRFGHAG